MTCNECCEYMPSKAMDGPADARLDEHLANCPQCRQEWESVSQGLGLLGAWEVEDVPADLSSRTMTRIQSEAAARPGFWSRLDRALQRFAAHRPTPLTGLATVAVTVMLLGQVLSPNLWRGRSSGDGTGCQRNLKVVAQALQAYGKEHNGRFPDRLEDLKPNYLQELPDCPDSGIQSYSEGYQVTADHRSYQLSCRKSP